jgi:UDPglucose 6-dehydrogenase
MHDILIVGVGYVGLVSGTCFAEMGNRVCLLDIDQEKIQKLQDGIIPIYEPGLQELVIRNAKDRRLVFTTKYKDAVELAHTCIFAVDTPVAADGSCDRRSLQAAASEVARHMTGYMLFINKSTAPVGTTEFIRKIISAELEKRGCDFDFDVVSNPEFLKEGSAVSDFMKPDRVVIGVDTERALTSMRELYRPFMLGSDRLIEMDPASAELTKYAANAMLALRVSFMNWLSQLCEESGANILQIRKGIGSDKRIGSAWAGVGYGGSCFPKDIKALRAMAGAAELSTSLVDAIEEINENQKRWLGSKIMHYFAPHGGLTGKTVGILGLAFKPDTDDMREAPSLVTIKQLLDEGVYLRLYDPASMANAKRILGDHPQISWCQDEYEVANGAHALMLLTEWKQFRLLKLSSMLSTMQGKAFFDGRNQYCPREMGRLGFDYISLGQNAVFAAFEQDFLVKQDEELAKN